MTGRWIDVAGDSDLVFRAYLAQPAQGSGPGILLCADLPATALSDLAEGFAEEGYVVLAPEFPARSDEQQTIGDITAALDTFRTSPAHKGMVGALGFGFGAGPAMLAAANSLVECAVLYDPDGTERASEVLRRAKVPMVLHCADGGDPTQAIGGKEEIEVYLYPDVSPGFAVAGPSYNKQAADMAYSRTIALLRGVIGPQFDLSALWEAHRRCEFVTRNPEETMKTMVAQPYVNHVPTMTGGFGQADLYRFYRDHFIPNNPKDMKNIPVSRTVGADRVVNEGILCFTHDTEIDWLLPGVKPTGRYVEVALIGIITFRGDKLIHEHIYWDQASVLVQIGLLDPTGLPVAGIEAAKKVLNPDLPSNRLLPNWTSKAS